MKRSSLPAILALASVVDFEQLLPRPRTNDCPKCDQSKLMRSESMSYCQRCAYVEKSKGARKK